MTKASKIRLIVSDVDGVWTDGRIVYVGERSEIKEFNVRDGLAVKLAQRAGIAVALVTSRRSAALERRARELGITTLRQGASSKLEETRGIARSLDLSLEQVLYLGDDLPDLQTMSLTGLSAAPSDAAPEVIAVSAWKLHSAGGRGAFREAVEKLLRARGQWDAIVEEFTSGRPDAQSI